MTRAPSRPHGPLTGRASRLRKREPDQQPPPEVWVPHGGARYIPRRTYPEPK